MAVGTGGGGSIGSVFVELDLDASRYTKGQQRLYRDATQTALNIEANFKKLNIKSSAEFDLMRQKITNAYNMIAHSSKATANDILRAEKAKNEQLKEINRQQFGEQTSLIDTLKKHWVAASVIIVGAIMAINRAMKYIDMGAQVERTETAFKSMAEASNINADKLITNMKRATKGVLNESDIMQKAIKMISFDYTAEEIERFSKNTIPAAIVSGQKLADVYDRLADAITNRMTRALKEMGAVTPDQMDIVQKAISAGAKTVDLFELSMANLELRTLQLSQTQLDSILAVQKYETAMKSLKEFIGTKMIGVFNELVEWHTLINAGFKVGAGLINQTKAEYLEYQAEQARLRGEFEKADELEVERWKHAIQGQKQLEKGIGLWKDYKDAVNDANKDAKAATDEELAAAKKAVADKIAALNALIEVRKKKRKDEKDALEETIKNNEKEKNQIKDYTQEIERLYKRFLFSHAAGYAEMSRSAQTGYEETMFYAKRSLDFQLQLFRSAKKEMLALGWTEEDWQAWYNARAFDAEIKSQETILQGLKNLIKYSDDAKTGIQAYYKELELSVYTWSQAAYDNVKNFAETSKSTFSEIFFDASTGDLKKFGDYWTSFMNSMKKKWAETLAEMLVQWLMFQAKTKIFKIFGSLFGGGGTGGGEIIAAAKGLAFDMGHIKHFQSGGIVSQPTHFPIGLMGEKGPEAILPLKRTKTGDLGVESIGPTLSISMPITINGGFNKKMVSDLRSDVEDLIERKVRAWV